CPAGGKMILENCTHGGGHYVVSLWPQGPTDQASLDLIRNTLVSRGVVVYYLNRPEAGDAGRNLLEVRLAGNLLDRQESNLELLQRREFLKHKPALRPEEAEALLKRQINWREQGNLRSVNLQLLQLGLQLPDGTYHTLAPGSVKTVGDWQKFW